MILVIEMCLKGFLFYYNLFFFNVSLYILESLVFFFYLLLVF